MRTTPPAWAEWILRVFLRPDLFGSVSGDLLEQYRDSILPVRGLARADIWYLKQVGALALRKVSPWAVLFAAIFVARFGWDILYPTTDFYLRSMVTTYTSIVLLVAAGFRSAWRSGSFIAGAVAGFATVAAAAVLSAGGNVAILTVWHDAGTMRAISGSGGLDEAFLLPAVLLLPGTAVGALGGIVGAGAKRLWRPA